MNRILLIDDPQSQAAGVRAQTLAATAGLGLERKPVRSPELSPWEQYPETAGKQDLAWLMPLDQCPLDLPEAWCITALSPRESAVLSLHFPSGQTPGQLLGLAPAAEVCAAGLAARYLHSIRPDLILTDQAAIRVDNWLTRASNPPGEERTLHPREFPPPPGAGVWAWLTHPEALPLRRLLKSMHHPDIVHLTNVERDLARRFMASGITETGIYAETDPQGHILLWMAWPDPEDGSIQRAGVSSSSCLGLADLAWAKTGLNFEYPITTPS